MKSAAACILTMMVLTIFMPLHFFAEDTGDDAPVIAALDVCSTSGPFVSSQSGAPTVHESPGCVFIPGVTEYLETKETVFTAFLLASKLLNPPRT